MIGSCFSWLIDGESYQGCFGRWFFQNRRALSDLNTTTTTTITTAAANFHDDIHLEILSRLPLPSVLQFQFLSKQWQSLTSTQFFIEMHDKNQPAPSTYTNVIHYLDYERGLPRLIFEHFGKYTITTNPKEGTVEYLTTRESMNLTSWVRDPKQFYETELLSSYKGFLLFTAKSHRVELALIFINPVIREVMIVTVPAPRYVYCGFFFHSPTKEYRVLYQVFDDNDHDDDDEGGMAFGFELLGLRTRSLRKINMNNDNNYRVKYHPDSSTPAVISNGALHWMVSEIHHQNAFGVIPSCSETILSFGMESEEFRLMPHPAEILDCDSRRRSLRGHWMSLLEMEGNLCLCDSYENLNLDIWVIKDYTKWIWVRRYVVRLYESMSWSFDTFFGKQVKVMQIHENRLLLGLQSNSIIDDKDYFICPLVQVKGGDVKMRKIITISKIESNESPGRMVFFTLSLASLRKTGCKHLYISLHDEDSQQPFYIRRE